MNKSENIDQLAPAMVACQSQIKTAKMDSTNPFFKSKYADLGSVWDAVRGALSANGFSVTQLPDMIGNEPALTTMLIHKSGQWISGTYPLMVTDKESTPQGYGSALTYARRYSLAALIGVIADEDDDGNMSSKRQAPSKPVTDELDQRITALRVEGKEAAEGGKQVLLSWWARLNYGDQKVLEKYKNLELKPIAEKADKAPAGV